jgi:dienelactone hydrolase
MCRALTCAAAALFVGSQAVAQEKISFPSTDGDLNGGTPTTITGYLYKPAGSGRFAGVVHLHGSDGLLGEKGEIHPWYGQWGEILSRAGYFVLLVDSFQPRGQRGPGDPPNILPNREVPRDAYGGMNYLRSRPDVRPDSIAIMGQSYGGAATLFTIAALPKALEKDFQAAVTLYPTCTRMQDAHWRPRLPMLLLMGDPDSGGSLAKCKELIADAEGASPIDAHFYPSTYHLFDLQNVPITVTKIKTPDGYPLIAGSNPEARADAINRVTQFLAKQLPQ